MGRVIEVKIRRENIFPLGWAWNIYRTSDGMLEAANFPSRKAAEAWVREFSMNGDSYKQEAR